MIISQEKLISDIVLQVLSYVAQFEREQIKQRQMEGIREAQKKGRNSVDQNWLSRIISLM